MAESKNIVFNIARLLDEDEKRKKQAFEKQIIDIREKLMEIFATNLQKIYESAQAGAPFTYSREYTPIWTKLDLPEHYNFITRTIACINNVDFDSNKCLKTQFNEKYGIELKFSEKPDPLCYYYVSL
jgi:hypothetical protein